VCFTHNMLLQFPCIHDQADVRRKNSHAGIESLYRACLCWADDCAPPQLIILVIRYTPEKEILLYYGFFHVPWTYIAYRETRSDVEIDRGPPLLFLWKTDVVRRTTTTYDRRVCQAAAPRRRRPEGCTTRTPCNLH